MIVRLNKINDISDMFKYLINTSVVNYTQLPYLKII